MFLLNTAILKEGLDKRHGTQVIFSDNAVVKKFLKQAEKSVLRVSSAGFPALLRYT